MKKQILAFSAILTAAVFFNQPASAQMTTPAATEAEKEAFYATTIENRVVDILKTLNLADEAKSNAVHDALVAQYHELRVRDAAIDTRLKVDGKEVNYRKALCRYCRASPANSASRMRRLYRCRRPRGPLLGRCRDIHARPETCLGTRRTKAADRSARPRAGAPRSP